MKKLDWYIIRQFLINYVILFVVMILLIVMLDLIINFDEFAKAAETQHQVELLLDDGREIEGMLVSDPKVLKPDRNDPVTVIWNGHEETFARQTILEIHEQRPLLGGVGRLIATIVDFYIPMLALFYIYMAGLLPIAAAGFTLASFLRNRELIAMLAGGISLYRVAMPILVVAFLTNLLVFVDQEVIIPNLAYKLSRGHSDLKYGGVKPFRVQFVPDEQGSLFSASSFDLEAAEMRDLTVLRRDEAGRAVARVTADLAIWDPQAGGWLLKDGLIDYRNQALPQSVGERQTTQAQPLEFLPSGLDPTTLALREHSRFRELLSLEQLGALMNKPSIIDTDELRLIQHSRFSLPVMNMLILVMGLPFFLLRIPGNLLLQSVKAAPLCLGAWAGGFVMLQIVPESLPAAAVAWLPVAAYLPVAFYLMDAVET